MIVFGGMRGSGSFGTSPLLNHTLVLENANGVEGTRFWPSLPADTQFWTGLTPSGAPPVQRLDHEVAYDSASNRMILVGGDSAFGFCEGHLNDAWVLENADGFSATPQWTQLNPSGALPPTRSQFSATYNQSSNRLTIFGGVQCNQSLDDLWVLEHADGQGGTPRWTELQPVGNIPPALNHHTAVYDPNSNRSIIFGGTTAGQLKNQVRVLSHSDGLGGTPRWTLLNVAQGPSARQNHTAVYDQGSNRMIIFGGHDSAGIDLNDVWVLDNANGLGGTPEWTEVTPSSAIPFARQWSSAVWDAAHDLMVIHGGRSGITALNDVWALSGVITTLDEMPNANDDKLTLILPLSDEPIDVLANDNDDQNDPLTIINTTTPSLGVIQIAPDNKSILFSADSAGTSHFSYTIDDGKGNQSTADVTVTVVSTTLNRAPAVFLQDVPLGNSDLVFSFTAVASGILTAQMFSQSAGRDIDIEILDSTGNLLGSGTETLTEDRVDIAVSRRQRIQVKLTSPDPGPSLFDFKLSNLILRNLSGPDSQIFVRTGREFDTIEVGRSESGPSGDILDILLSNKEHDRTTRYDGPLIHSLLGPEPFFRLNVSSGPGNDTINVNSSINNSSKLNAGPGHDTVNGGSGPDNIVGDRGNDNLNGLQGDDTASGQLGNDRIKGGDDNDRLIGGDGNDKVWGQRGHDKLEGNAGNDLLIGGTGNDILIGGSGRDTLLGQQGNDQLLGQGDADQLEGFTGHDTLKGGGSLDEYVFSTQANLGRDTISDSRASAQLNFAKFGFAVQLDLSNPDAQVVASKRLTLVLNSPLTVIDASGSAFDDSIVGNRLANSLAGGKGHDLLIGDRGNDNLIGDNGNDTLNGGLGADNIDGGNNQDVVEQPRGEDTIQNVERFPSLVFRAPNGTRSLNIQTTVGEQLEIDLCNQRPAISGINDLCGGPFRVPINPRGGYPPYRFRLGSGTGFPPTGIILGSNGRLQGRTTATGTSRFEVCAVDLRGENDCIQVSITVNAPVINNGDVFVVVVGGGTVTDSTNQINCPNGSCRGRYGPNDFPFLTATPNPGWFFDRWIGTSCFVSQCPLVPHEFRDGLLVVAVFERL